MFTQCKMNIWDDFLGRCRRRSPARAPRRRPRAGPESALQPTRTLARCLPAQSPRATALKITAARLDPQAPPSVPGTPFLLIGAVATDCARTLGRDAR
ncbi:hypothetical protein PYCCODRAFT_719983 [Trametes coccinea BRFM310]|uniref:Uncharacterized protein n=1 Tax=Trametes coccinea (strain BRFM310) TaxID=1353009 RepID=A0A1Y2IGE8_TRAC3|nr:hypothetical protein PYCCODRAFT_719983 [Trametes coccinea BRFM310]